MYANKAFVMRRIGKWNLLIPIRKNDITQTYFTLNDMGAFIWNFANKVSNIQELVAHTIDEFNLKEITEKKQVKLFCESLVANKLLFEKKRKF